MLIKLLCIQLKYSSLSEKPIKAVYGCDVAAGGEGGRGGTLHKLGRLTEPLT